MSTQRIAVIGGTGPQGRGLAYRWARAGHDVVLGSRSVERAAGTAQEVVERIADVDGAGTVGAEENAAAAHGADVVVLAVPHDGHDELVAGLAEHLDGKVVLSCVNPLGFDKAGPYALHVEGGSAAETAAALVPTARVVGAFHHVSAVTLWGEGGPLEHEDVLVCGDDAEAKQVAMDLAVAVTGRPGVDVGPLRLARQLEPFTAVLIGINKRYKTRSGIRVSGI